MTLGRRTEIIVEWESVDITRDLKPHLLALSYTDNLSGAADDLSLELEDRGGLWSGDWKPTQGDTVVARLKATPWLTKVSDLRLGKFAHDEINISGPPKKTTLKCVSAPVATGLRRQKRTRAWGGVTLKQIAADIAERAELTLQWEGAAGRTYRRREQKQKSDLEFLEEACLEVGRTLKVTEDKIVIFDEYARDATAPVGDIDLEGGYVLSPGGYNFNSADGERYGKALITFFNPRTGKSGKGEFPAKGKTVAGLDPNGQTLELRMSVDDAGHAADRARALLRAANRFANKGKLVTVGDPGLVAGVTFNLVNAQAFNGKYIITRAEHRATGGYTCSLDVRRCLEGY